MDDARLVLLRELYAIRDFGRYDNGKHWVAVEERSTGRIARGHSWQSVAVAYDDAVTYLRTCE